MLDTPLPRTVLVIIDTGFSLASSKSFIKLLTVARMEVLVWSMAAFLNHSEALEFTDVACSIVSEFFFYPFLISDIMEFVTGQIYRGETVEDNVSFVIVNFETIVLVYITRLLLLGGIIYNVHEHH